MRIYKEENSKEEFDDIVKGLIVLTKKLRSYCTSNEAYNSLLNNKNKGGR